MREKERDTGMSHEWGEEDYKRGERPWTGLPRTVRENHRIVVAGPWEVRRSWTDWLVLAAVFFVGLVLGHRF